MLQSLPIWGFAGIFGTNIFNMMLLLAAPATFAIGLAILSRFSG